MGSQEIHKSNRCSSQMDILRLAGMVIVIVMVIVDVLWVYLTAYFCPDILVCVVCSSILLILFDEMFRVKVSL